jgi:hypothetical protein
MKYSRSSFINMMEHIKILSRHGRSLLLFLPLSKAGRQGYCAWQAAILFVAPPVLTLNIP